MDGWVGGRVDGWMMDGWMDEWVGGWVGRGMDRWLVVRGEEVEIR